MERQIQYDIAIKKRRISEYEDILANPDKYPGAIKYGLAASMITPNEDALAAPDIDPLDAIGGRGIIGKAAQMMVSPAMDYIGNSVGPYNAGDILIGR